jgi:hypothetical protein
MVRNKNLFLSIPSVPFPLPKLELKIFFNGAEHALALNLSQEFSVEFELDLPDSNEPTPMNGMIVVSFESPGSGTEVKKEVPFEINTVEQVSMIESDVFKQMEFFSRTEFSELLYRLYFDIPLGTKLPAAFESSNENFKVSVDLLNGVISAEKQELIDHLQQSICRFYSLTFNKDSK